MPNSSNASWGKRYYEQDTDQARECAAKAARTRAEKAPQNSAIAPQRDHQRAADQSAAATEGRQLDDRPQPVRRRRDRRARETGRASGGESECQSVWIAGVAGPLK